MDTPTNQTVFADSYGFDEADATRSLQAAINDPNADRIVVRDMGKPWLVSQTVFLKSNKEIVFEEGVVVQAKPGTFLDNTKPMFRALSLDNLKIIGKGEGEKRATLKMNKAEYTRSEFGHILGIDGVKDFEIRGLKLTGAGGDGIHVAGATYQTAKPGLRTYSENGIIEDIIADNNRRQGISIDSAKNVVVRDSTFSNTSGTAPSAGIDLEPTWDFERLQDIKIENVTLTGNDGNGIQLALGNLDDDSAPVSIDIDNVTIDNNNRSGVTVVLFNSDPDDPYRDQPDGSLPGSMANGTVNIRNATISRSNGTNTFFNQATAGIYVQSLPGNRSDDPNNLRVNFENVEVSDTGNGEFASNPIYIRGFGGPTQPQQVGNLSFKNVVVKDNFDRPVVKAELGRPDAYLSNIVGDITAFNPNGITTDFDLETPPGNFSLKVTDGTQAPQPPVVPPFPPPNPNPTTTGLVASYSFDNMISDIAFDNVREPFDVGEAGNNPGQLYGVTRDEGELGRYVIFDGDGLLKIPNTRDINLGIKKQRTVSLRFKLETQGESDRLTGGKQVLYEEGAAVRGLNAYVDGDRLFVGGWNRPTQESNWQGTWLQTSDIKADTWHRLTLVLDGDSTVEPNAITAYLDGEAFGSGEASQLWSHSGGIGLGGVNQGTRFHDGTVASSGNGLTGAIDEVRIFNNALTSAEVQGITA